MARITINGNTFDPVAHSTALRAASLSATDASQSDYVLVQTRGRLAADQKAQLADLGVVVHEYIPDNAYLCGYKPADLDAIRELPFVVWADVYMPALKIVPSLRESPPPEKGVP